MSGFVPKASFSTLPPELYGFIIPDPIKAHPELKAYEYSVSHWSPFAVKSHRSRETWGETLRLLRALSHTCAGLRNYALPLLWSGMNVESVNELGKLRDAIRLMPHLARSVRIFSFSWQLSGDMDGWACLPYHSNHGSMLDMAFIDRGALWDSAKHAFGATSETGQFSSSSAGIHFRHEGVVYPQPGWWDKAEHKSTPASIHVGRSGPDCNGQDPRINNALDFTNCVTEIVSHLTSLEAFCWSTEITPIPVEVFQILRGNRELKSFGTSFWCWRSFQHVPLWELASRLERFTIFRLGDIEEYWFREVWHKDSDRVASVDEREILALEAPATPCLGSDDVLVAMAWRTIVVAAKGGRLRELALDESHLHALWKPFAVPSLLPAWVGIDDWGSFLRPDRVKEVWGSPEYRRQGSRSEHWVMAAVMLRRAASKASATSWILIRHVTSSRFWRREDNGG